MRVLHSMGGGLVVNVLVTAPLLTALQTAVSFQVGRDGQDVLNRGCTVPITAYRGDIGRSDVTVDRRRNECDLCPPYTGFPSSSLLSLPTYCSLYRLPTCLQVMDSIRRALLDGHNDFLPFFYGQS